AERVENALAEELIERHAGGDLDDAAEGVEAGLCAIGPAGAGLEFERGRAEAWDVAGEIFFRAAIELAGLGVADGSAGEAGDVSQQIADRDVVFGRNGVEERHGAGRGR